MSAGGLDLKRKFPQVRSPRNNQTLGFSNENEATNAMSGFMSGDELSPTDQLLNSPSASINVNTLQN